MIYFTADEHYYHKNVIRYCDRPFKDIKTMHHELIIRHNAIVNDDDIVFHIGDFAMVGKNQPEKVSAILSKLKGQHHLILGNHDEMKPFTYVNCGFISVHTSFELLVPSSSFYMPLKSLGYEKFTLNHDPSVYCLCKNSILICGHIHTLFRTLQNKKAVNVGVDMWEFEPVSIKRIVDLTTSD